MFVWTPTPEWQGEDAYVVGGGPSLRSFDWGLLRGKNTIGCNSAFLLGVDIIKIVVFGDVAWWNRIGREGTAKYGGRVVGCTPTPLRDDCPWLLTMDREEHGLGTDKLGWNANTGSLALNLALILGAQRVYLLGFDMKLGSGNRANWHDLRCEDARADVYNRFLDQFRDVAMVLPKVFPGREVWNVTDGSELDYFPKVGLKDRFGTRVGKEEVRV